MTVVYLDNQHTWIYRRFMNTCNYVFVSTLDTEWLLSSVSDCNILPLAYNVVIDFNSYVAIYIFFFKLLDGTRIHCDIRTFFLRSSM